MSTVDIERFVADLKGNAALLGEAKAAPGGLGAMVDLAKSKGYDITVDEAKSYIADKANQELSDDQLDTVAGGKGHHVVGPSTVQTTQTITTAQTTAEVVTTTAEAVNTATTVAVVAEGVIVLT